MRMLKLLSLPLIVLLASITTLQWNCLWPLRTSFEFDANQIEAFDNYPGQAWKIRIPKGYSISSKPPPVLLENGETKGEFTTSTRAVARTPGHFTVTKKWVWFQPANGSDPTKNGKNYSLSFSLVKGVWLKYIAMFFWVVLATVISIKYRKWGLLPFLYFQKMFLGSSHTGMEWARVGIASSFLILAFSNFLSINSIVESIPPNGYYPKGLLLEMFGSLGKTPLFVHSLWWGLIIGSAGLIKGGSWTQPAICIGTFSVILLSGISSSTYPIGWSHGYIFNCLALIPFCFYRWEKSNWKIWPVVTAAFLIALGLANAFWFKFMEGNYSFEWAFSDNLRNSFIARYNLLGEEAPSYVSWIADHPIRWQSLAFCNLLAQIFPLLGCIFFTNRWLRLFFGMFLILETLGLYLIMGLPNFQWLPFAVFWFPWKIKHHQIPTHRGVVTNPGLWVSAILISVTFLIAFVLPAGMDYKLRSFPFSQFRVYKIIRSDRPHHFSKGILFEIESPATDPGEKLAAEKRLQRLYTPQIRTLTRNVKNSPLIGDQVGGVLELAAHKIESEFGFKPKKIHCFRISGHFSEWPEALGYTVEEKLLVSIWEDGP